MCSQITDYTMLPDTGSLSERLRVCLQEGDENPPDFTSLFDMSSLKLHTNTLPSVLEQELPSVNISWRGFSCDATHSWILAYKNTSSFLCSIKSVNYLLWFPCCFLCGSQIDCLLVDGSVCRCSESLRLCFVFRSFRRPSGTFPHPSLTSMSSMRKWGWLSSQINVSF